MGKATCENSSFAHLYSSDPTIGCRYSKLCNWNFFRACSSAGIVFRTGCFPMKEPGLSTVTCPSPCHANLQKKKRESSLSQGMLLHQMLMTPAITINLKLRLTSICKNLKGVGGDGNSKVFCGHCTLVVLGSSASREGVCENATCTSKEPKWRESRRRSSNKQRALFANWWHMQ